MTNGQGRPASSGQIDHRFLKHFRRGRCLHPSSEECRGRPIRAHSIQRSESLAEIAENGHILQYSMSFRSLDTLMKHGFVSPKRIGIGKANTFMGFCEKHDSQLFEPIERNRIRPTAEQACLLAFRATARELLTKENARNSLELMNELERDRPPNEKRAIEQYKLVHKVGMELGIRDLLAQIEYLKVSILDRSFEDIAYLSFQINKIPEVMCSSVFQVDYDYDRNQLQDLAERDDPCEWMAVNILSHRGNGIVLLTWPKSFLVSKQFIGSLLRQPDIPNSIIRLVFDYVENHAFSPTWWDSLSVLKKKCLCRRAFDVYHRDAELNPTHLWDDRKHYVDWKIISSSTNVQDVQVTMD